MTPSLKGQTAVVVGLGKSGVAAVRLLLRAGAKVFIEEVRRRAELGSITEELVAEGALLTAGKPLTTDALCGKNLIVVSPGVPLSQAPLREAKAAGQKVVGEVELASWFLRPKVPIVGITGTNGKSTTTALCGEILTQAGLRPFVGGNLGRPLSEAALSNEAFGAYVTELSSYQLEGMETPIVSPAALTNLAPDHLDRYATYADYQAAKARIFRGPGAAVVNLGDTDATKLAVASERWIYGFGATSGARELVPPDRLVGEAVPHENGFQVTLMLPEAGEPAFRKGEAVRVFELRNRALRGTHNLENAMTAALLARLCGVFDDRIQRGLDSFPGLPHRLELVRTLNGVEWVNDSKATNVDSTLVALKALAHQPLWLIAGGKGKGAPYTPLLEFAKRVKGVLTVGSDAPNIEKTFSASHEVVACETLDRAVREAHSRARSGDAVLLSPACASFDQFKNFEDRGQTFRRLVEAL